MKVFDSVADAIRAGYEMLTFYPDSEGNFQARKEVDATHYAIALVKSMETVAR